MHISRLEISGYRRFAERQTIRFDTKLTALVGPNEAGKSSLLKALLHIGREGPFSSPEDEMELTRIRDVPDNECVLRADFSLSTDDQSALEETVEDFRSVVGLTFFKYADGSIGWKCFSKRWEEDLQDGLTALRDGLALQAPAVLKTTQYKSLKSLTAESIGKLDDHELIKAWERVRTQVDPEKVQLDGVFSSFAQTLFRIHQEVTGSLRILKGRVPRFLQFDDAHRSLKSSYVIEGTKPGNRHPEPFPDGNDALDNLIQISGQRKEDLVAAVKGSRHGRIMSWTRKANEQLTEALLSNWSQAALEMHLYVNAKRLFVHVGHGNDPDPIGSRSDGFRQFLALGAYVARHAADQRPTVLLIDEAERHLHYDAQTDLVRMLTEQQFSTQVIYTTHSAGCLPNDIGMSVKAIEPVESGESRVADNIWLTSQPSASVLYFAMGASAIARGADRRAVYTEGTTDSACWPRLFWEASGGREATFQALPGASHFTRDSALLALRSSQHVAFLLDGDEGGKERERLLVEANVPSDQIIRLPEEMTLEDLISAEAMAAAYNRVLSQYAPSLSVEPSELPAKGRVEYVRRLAVSNAKDEPARQKVIAEVLTSTGVNNDSGILDPKHVDLVSELVGRLERALEVTDSGSPTPLQPIAIA